MNFDSDDPLAGILSDESDDSFFDDDLLGKKKSSKKSTPVASKKSTLFNLDEPTKEKLNPNLNEKKNALFDLDDDIIKTSKTDTTSLNEQVAPKSNLPRQDSGKLKTASSIKIASNDLTETVKPPAVSRNLHSKAEKIDNLDPIKDNVKKDPKKPLERGKSSQSILDDILGTPTKKPFIEAPKKQLNQKQDFDLDDILGKSENKPPLTKSIKIKKENPTTQQKEGTKLKKTTSDDWLGIFHGKEDKPDDQNEEDMPSWLLGSDNKKTKPVEKSKTEVKDTNKKITKNETNSKEEDVTAKEQPEVPQNINIDQPINTTIPNILNQNTNEDITAESTALYLKQQESQLMVALQLKAQEEKLAVMQLKQEEGQRLQREMSRAQHQQIDSMLERQAANRIQMQSVIAAHQERINQRIKALLGTSNLEDDINVNEEGASGDNVTKVVNPHMKEKKQLLQLVQSLQENHDKEIDLMETSYRRQLAFIEVSLNQSEDRMKEESDKLVKFYSEKIVWLEDHHLTFKRLAEENMQNLIEGNKNEIEILRHQHSENTKVLQEHHAELIENIRNAVKQEQNLVKESTEFSANLIDLVKDVKENKTSCELMLQTVKSLVENTQRDTERNIQVKDSQINDMLQQLKKEKENLEMEKSESRGIVQLLESRLKQMTQHVEDETSALKQKRMEFDFEKATFTKQTEFAKNLLKQQEEEIKKIREDIQKEYQLKITSIENDKAKIQQDVVHLAKEKSSIENLKQELEKMKAELQVQLEEATKGRAKLNLDKQNIQIEAQKIAAKNRDLELLTKSVMENQAASDQKFAEAESIQQKYEDGIRKIQEQIVSLNSREKQIAREKVALSRERLSLHNERKSIESRQKCSLCKSMHNVSDFEPKYVTPECYLGVSRNYTDVEVNSAMINLEQEMAHLLGRNLGLKATVGVEGTISTDSAKQEVISRNDRNDAAVLDYTAKYKEYMDPKLQMLRLDVQRVIGIRDQRDTVDVNTEEDCRS